MNIIIQNPLSQWLYWVANTIFYKFKYFGKGLDLGYMTNIQKTKFGRFNSIYKQTRLREVEIGDYSYIAKESQIYYTSIGKFCCIGANVKTGLGLHPSSDFVSSHPIFYSTIGQAAGQKFVQQNKFTEFVPTYIGHDVWIGDNAIIMPGITIGNGAIIAAGSVVTKNVDPYTIVGGIPAKAIRLRFDETTIKDLQDFKWWDQPESWLRLHHESFSQIKDFIALIKNNKI